VHAQELDERGDEAIAAGRDDLRDRLVGRRVRTADRV
jgi:hypothetical protein